MTAATYFADRFQWLMQYLNLYPQQTAREVLKVFEEVWGNTSPE